jgi:hypothetical protein
MTYLTENLASKGYVVAAIDHTDSVFGAQAAFVSTCSIGRSKSYSILVSFPFTKVSLTASYI